MVTVGSCHARFPRAPPVMTCSRSTSWPRGSGCGPARGRPDVLPRALADLGHFCDSTLLPHLERDERWLRDAQDCAEGHLLAQAMRAEIRAMTGVIEELGSVSEACEAMALTRVVHSFLVAHDHHENLLRDTVTTS